MSAIRLVNVEYRVPEKTILHGIDLEIAEGEILAVMGMSGSGKTTLLKCMAALLRPTSGRIIVDGEDIVPLGENELDRVRLKMGLVFQYAALFDSLSVFDNVAFGLVNHRRMNRSEVRRAVRDRLADVGMEGTEGLYPSQLSGGMQKRVGLARALATEPRILYYDEPTSGLDPVIARNIDELIVSTRDRKKVTSVVVSHDIASIFRIADRVAMIHEGRLVATGTPEEMRASSMPEVRQFVRDAGAAANDRALA